MQFRKIVFIGFLLIIFIALGSDLSAQCPMCKIAAESNLENGGTEGAGLNRGILYMLAMPYLLVLTIGFIWYRNKKLSEKEDQSV